MPSGLRSNLGPYCNMSLQAISNMFPGHGYQKKGRVNGPCLQYFVLLNLMFRLRTFQSSSLSNSQRTSHSPSPTLPFARPLISALFETVSQSPCKISEQIGTTCAYLCQSVYQWMYAFSLPCCSLLGDGLF